jgi:hypothetical protein
MDFKNGKWAKEIIQLQHDDGSWGYFHTLSKPSSKQPMTTEQALRRLEILGFTIDDNPIQKTVKYLHNCLIGKENIPDYQEKGSDWKSYHDLMISTWIKRFTSDDKSANGIANKWVEIINSSFAGKKFEQNIYDSVYNRILCPEKGKRIWGFMHFYGISILANNLDISIEPKFFEYVLNFPTGIYYFGYNKSIKTLPELFQSKKTCDYIRMVDLLTAYKNKKCKDKILYIKKWFLQNKLNDHEWDLGKNSKDNILLPLSDSWRKDEDRINDCTFVINRIIKKM